LNTSDWNLIGQFVAGTLQKSALVTDGKPTSRPLTSEAYNPKTIDAFFDSISYDKGIYVIHYKVDQEYNPILIHKWKLQKSENAFLYNQTIL